MRHLKTPLFKLPNQFKEPFVINTVEPRYNEGPRGWKNLFSITRFLYIEVIYYYWGKENRPLYRGLRYIEVRYIKVPLKLRKWYKKWFGVGHTGASPY